MKTNYSLNSNMKTYWLNVSNGNYYHVKSGKRASSVRQWILRGKI